MAAAAGPARPAGGFGSAGGAGGTNGLRRWRWWARQRCNGSGGGGYSGGGSSGSSDGGGGGFGPTSFRRGGTGVSATFGGVGRHQRGRRRGLQKRRRRRRLFGRRRRRGAELRRQRRRIARRLVTELRITAGTNSGNGAVIITWNPRRRRRPEPSTFVPACLGLICLGRYAWNSAGRRPGPA